MTDTPRRTPPELVAELDALTAHHRVNCRLYGDYVEALFGDRPSATLADLPYLPVRAFKSFDLKSVADDEVFKVMTSSGTGGSLSRIFLDRETARLQSQKLAEVFTGAFSKVRHPMLVIDSEKTVTDPSRFSARTAAINGFGLFSRGREFALDDNLDIDIGRVEAFLDRHRESRIFVFGFTFVVWQHLVEALRRSGARIDLSNAFLLHGGGWKKLAELDISTERFKAGIAEWTGCTDVRNYYGMVEQTGTIFMECPHGNLHAAAGSDALVRDTATFAPLPHGEQGLIQVFSTIQRSYPGHSLLTEDVGMTFDGASCPCGHAGTIVRVFGRLKKAEVRGCSDAYTAA